MSRALGSPLITTSRGVSMLYAINAHGSVLPAYRRATACPIEPDPHIPRWTEVASLNRRLALSGDRRFRGVRYCFRRMRDVRRLSPREILTLTLHPDERVGLALLRAVFRASDRRSHAERSRFQFVAMQIAERGRWLATLGARWNVCYDALVALDLAMYVPTPARDVIDGLTTWVESVSDPRVLESALRFRCARLLELVAGHIRCADPAFVQALIERAPVAAPALVMNPHVDDALRQIIATTAVARLQHLRMGDEHMPGVADWVAPILAARRNLLIALGAMRERCGDAPAHVVLPLVQDAALDRVRPVARMPARCRTARQALLALGFPMPRDVTERSYLGVAEHLRTEMIRWIDWQPASPVGRRFRILGEATRDAEYATEGPYAPYAPQQVGSPACSATLQRVGTLAALTLLRALSPREFRSCLVHLSRAGLRLVRRVCELATREQLLSVTPTTLRRLTREWCTRDSWYVLSVLPVALRDPSIRQYLIDRVDPYIATQILPELAPDEQRKTFRALCAAYPANALQLVERNTAGILAAVHPSDFTMLLGHWMPEIRLRALTALHAVHEAPRASDESAATEKGDGGERLDG